MNHPEVILFDLGGVLIELSGIATMMAWTRLPEDEIWRRWLASEPVHAFEAGRMTTEDFAAAVVTEFEMDVSPETFIEAFLAWPRGLFPGTAELLDELRHRYHLACLSNTNHLHWAWMEEKWLKGLLHTHFVSFEIGMTKPNAEIFEHTIVALGCPAGSILFLDDNQVNVDAAASAGMNAALTRGIDGVRASLTAAGVLTGQ